MTHIYAVYSAGGFGREIMPALQANYRANDVEFVFVDDNIQDEQVNGVAVLTYEKFTAMSAESKKIVIAVADSKIREKLADKCEKDRKSTRLNSSHIFAFISEPFPDF